MMNQVELSNGVFMPLIGYGTFRVDNSEALADMVYYAIKTGYRSIDTAQIYGNEESVGEGIERALKEKIVTREDLFITTKVWNDGLSFESALEAYETSLHKLKIDYVDLYLIHWPGKQKYLTPWKALEHLYNNKKVRAIGVSNFDIDHLKEILTHCSIRPMVNQIELHPLFSQIELRDFCKEEGIKIEAWSPLMNGELLDHEMINEFAKVHSKSSAQIILRWNIQHGVITIPKSMTKTRIESNVEIFDFKLSKAEMNQIDHLNKNYRSGPDPHIFDF